MRMMPQVGFEEASRRVGMQVLGGNLNRISLPDQIHGQSVGTAAWSGRGMGIFVVDRVDPEIVELEARASRDAIVCSVVLNDDDAQTDFVIGDRRFGAEGADMTMIFVPQGERFHFATRVSRGLKAVTIVVDFLSMMEAYGLPATALPKTLLRTIRGGQAMMDKLVPGQFGSIARDVAARRGMFPSLSQLYFESKTLDLVSALLNQLSRQDPLPVGDGVSDPGILDRLSSVKQIIDRAPHRALDIDALARVAVMNRTKLRSAFKQAYGTTLADYRTDLLLELADRALRETGASVKQVAHRAGYATASGFIVAYKRLYGICPGGTRRHDALIS
jgi:AraC-like DNA-binding protein